MSDSITSLPQPRPSDGSSRASGNTGSSGQSASSSATDGSRDDAGTGSRDDRSNRAHAASGPAPATNRSGNGSADGRSDAARVEVSSIEIDTLDEEALSRLPAGQQEAVKKLHTQVARAVTTIEALTTENQRLRERVNELEDELDQRPDVADGETVLTLPDDPTSLRETVDHFIDAIDAYLQGETIPNEGPSDSPAAASGGE